MIDKKMKGVHEGIALATGVAATAAVGQAQTPLDLGQYSNLTISR
jgi:hypothetical protein